MSHHHEQRPLLPYTIQVNRYEESREWSTNEIVAEIPVRAVDDGAAKDVGEAIIKLYEREYRVNYDITVTQPVEEI